MSKPTVAVIFGSRSAEHDISIITAINAIITPLRAGGQYDPLPVYITKDGRWFAGKEFGDIKTYTSGKIDRMTRQKPAQLLFEKGFFIKSGKGLSKYQKIDLVFPATHGTYGEDGSLMGLLRMADVPFVGCDLSASAIAMDKVLSRVVCSQAGIAQNEFEWFTSDEFSRDQKVVLKQLARLKFPLFVKPAHLGSSIGISRVKNQEELINAIEVATHYDDKVLVEEEVANLIEVTLPIMGNDDLQPALLERPLSDPEKFFDFDTKYLQGGKKGKSGAKGSQGYSEIPAKLPKGLEEKATALAQNVYRTLGCSGLARVDMLIDSKKAEVYFNEVNPLPGSLYMHNWKKAGFSSVDLVHRLIELAQERYAAQQKLTTTFDTSFLNQF